MNPAITSKARRHLRALAHRLKPVVLVGKDGVSPELVGATNTALGQHELIKVKLGENASGDRSELADAIASATGAAQVGLIGRVLMLYKQHPKEPKITLPSEKPAKKPDSKKSSS